MARISSQAGRSSTLSDGAWLTDRAKDDKDVKAFLKWRSKYNPVFLELKIPLAGGVSNGKPNIAGALKVLAELADKHNLVLTWDLRLKKKGM